MSNAAVCSGAIFSIVGPAVLEKRAKSLCAAITSACRESSQKSSFSLR